MDMALITRKFSGADGCLQQKVRHPEAIHSSVVPGDISRRFQCRGKQGKQTTSRTCISTGLLPSVLGLCLTAGSASAWELPGNPPEASAAEGTAMTVESGGHRTGCVDWSYRVLPAPVNKHVRQVRLAFDFANRCQREVSVVLARQTFDGSGGARYGQALVLKPGASIGYQASGKVGNYLLFDPDRDRWLEFWVHQSDQRFRAGVFLDMARCNRKFPPPDPRPPRPPHPSCPPGLSYAAAGQ